MWNSVRGQTERSALGTNFGRHQALRAGSEPHQHELAGTQLRHTEAAQSLHMDEDIGSPVASCHKPETAKPIEPIDLCPFETACRGHSNMGSRRRHLRRVDRSRLIHGDDTESLQALWPRQHFANNARAFVSSLIAIAAKAGHMQQHVGQATVWNDEAITFGNIKPFDDSSHLDDRPRRLITEIDIGSESRADCFWFDSVRRHDAEAAASGAVARVGAHESLETKITLGIKW